MAGISIIWTANVSGQAIHLPIGTPLPDLPQVVSHFKLQAVNDPATGTYCVFGQNRVPFSRALYRTSSKPGCSRRQWLSVIKRRHEL
jgi:hypothetical protein